MILKSEFAMWNLFSVLIAIPYSTGKPISSILIDCPRIALQCEDVSQTTHAMAVRVMWQMLHSLRQTSFHHNPTDLEGDIFSDAQDKETNPMHLSFVHLARGELSFFHADYEVTAKRALEVGERYSKLIPAYLPGMIELFHRGVALFAAARRTKKRKYRVEARRLAKKIEKWVSIGNPNVTYYHLFLTAEQMALDKMYDMAEQKYEEAIEMATLEGHLHHIGLLNERYSDYLMEVRSREEESKDRLKQAIRYYEEWGACWKVQTLEARL
mmetsp:Transcript_12635/g.30174  ORF Transcript_12635/g.30174 Transcript_12635/m.30174 type:complete len:269 (-) Transcript_12635:105-911(-)